MDTICTDALLERTQPCVIFLPAATRESWDLGPASCQRSREGFYWLVSYHRAISTSLVSGAASGKREGLGEKLSTVTAAKVRTCLQR